MLVLDSTVHLLSSVCKEIKIQHMDAKDLIYEVVLVSLQRREVAMVAVERRREEEEFLLCSGKVSCQCGRGCICRPQRPVSGKCHNGVCYAAYLLLTTSTDMELDTLPLQSRNSSSSLLLSSATMATSPR